MLIVSQLKSVGSSGNCSLANLCACHLTLSKRRPDRRAATNAQCALAVCGRPSYSIRLVSNFFNFCRPACTYFTTLLSELCSVIGPFSWSKAIKNSAKENKTFCVWF